MFIPLTVGGGISTLADFERVLMSGADKVSVNSGAITQPETHREFAAVPVIASGGAGSIEDFIKLFREVPRVDAGLAASIFHFREITIRELKERLSAEGINVRRMTA